MSTLPGPTVTAASPDCVRAGPLLVAATLAVTVVSGVSFAIVGPSPVVLLLAAAGQTAVALTALLVPRLALALSPAVSALRAARRTPCAPLELLARAESLHGRLELLLAKDDPARATLDASALELARAISSWPAPPSTPVADDERSLADLEQRSRTTTDEIAATEYRQAHAELQAKLAHHRAADALRERIVARLHRTIASWERLELALAHHRAADAAHRASTLAALAEDVGAVGQELERQSAALDPGLPQ